MDTFERKNANAGLKFFFGKDYSGAKFLYTEPISLKKAHATK